MQRLDYQEPVAGQDFTFILVERSRLINSKYQRDFSSALAKKLINSVSKGFIMPIVAVEDGEGELEVIDGQHRLGAFDKVCYEDDPLIPTIILPYHFRYYPLFYNIEKTDNIKDKSSKIHRLYLDMEYDEWTERDVLPATNYEPYIISLSFAYCEYSLQSPSLVEPVVKKVDNEVLMGEGEDGFPAPLSLSDAIEIRRTRASLAAQLEQAVATIARENAISDFNLKKSIISQASQVLWGRKRKIDESPEEAIPGLIDQIESMDWSWMAGR